MKWLRLAIFGSLTAAFGLLVHPQHEVGGTLMPPIARFLNPFAGFWQNGTNLDVFPDRLEFPELRAPVRVKWDDRRVPHIFALNEVDLAFAQGYITARERLWQIEFQTMFGAGRLSEIIGPRGYLSDRFRRRIGIQFAAENAIRQIMADSSTAPVVRAYCAGINARIDELTTRSLPLEYKVLDYRPERWTPVKSAVLFKMLTWDLSSRSSDRLLTAAKRTFPPDLFAELYPLYPPGQEPIIPAETKWPFAPVAAPSASNVTTAAAETAWPAEPLWEPIDGSNNWAVSGARTRSGYPILANDPHLGLSLPAVWYEVQLHAPGVNVCGVSLPGAPGVVIGFNEQIAWGVTNGGSDVMDFYRISFQDSTRRAYWRHGKWQATVRRPEVIRIRGAETQIDSVIYTDLGPIVQLPGEREVSGMAPPDYAMRWQGHDPSNEVKAFAMMNRARNYRAFKQGLALFDSPAQNFAYADRHGDIALVHNGKLPVREGTSGRFLLEGATAPPPAWIPREHLPQVRNPERGFVSSANQHPTAPGYPYFLGWRYAGFERALRINQQLSGMENITAQDMIDLQLDNTNMLARKTLPKLLELLDSNGLNVDEQRAVNALKSWDYENRAMLAAPLLFSAWWRAFFIGLWEDDIVRESGTLPWPRSDVTAEMLIQAKHEDLFDDLRTPERESLADIVSAAFRKAAADLRELHGPIDKNWAWGRARGTDIRHMARIPGLGRMRLFTSGDRGIVNATSRYHGPSVRLVVEMGPELRAWGVYPGGQSGNPGSTWYDNMVTPWVEGKMQPLLFLRSADVPSERIVTETALEPR